MKPRVARIVSYLPVGGVEKRLLAILKKLKSEFEVEVVCIHSRGKLAPLFEEAGIPVTVIPFKGRLHPVSLYRLATYLKKRMVDIVHTHMYRPNISGTLAARLAGVPVVISNVHNVDHWDTSRQVFMDRLLRPLRNGVIAVSQGVKKDVVDKTGVSPEGVVVVYNGVDLEEFKTISLERRRAKKAEMGIEGDIQVLLVVARLMPWKGHKLLFQVLKEAAPFVPPFRLLVVGGGPMRKELEDLSLKEGLAWTVFLGERHDVPQLLSLARVSFLPSLKEGFPNVVLEAMASGVPSVVTDVGGTGEALVGRKEGIVVPPGDKEALKEAILSVLNHPASLKKMGLESKRRVQSRFSIEVMYRRTRELYLSLLDGVGDGQV